MDGLCRVNGEDFAWRVFETEDFPRLHPIAEERIRVLRIWSTVNGFDIVMRVSVARYVYPRDATNWNGWPENAYVYHTWIGPALVLGTAFPNDRSPVAVGTRLALRPKVTSVPTGIIDGAIVQRIVQWCKSSRFRSHPCGIF